MGFAICSPFDWFTGDKMMFYARTRGAQIRFEDSGATLFELEGAGVDLTSNTRLQSLKDLCHECGVTFNEEESQFYTEWLPAQAVGIAAIKFMAFMNRVQDLLFTTRSRVAGTFKEDLLAAVEERFSGEATVESNASPVPALGYYVVDIVIRHKNGRTAAIFPATSEEKALGAVLFAKELELKNIDNVVPFLIFEQTGGGKVSKGTQAKALNSELQLATWDGGSVDVLDKIAKHVRQ
jgi:hypothetical protein